MTETKITSSAEKNSREGKEKGHQRWTTSNDKKGKTRKGNDAERRRGKMEKMER